MKRVLLSLGLAVLLACSAMAQQTATVRLAWDANNPAEQVTKYTVYERTGTVYTKLVDVTEPQAALPGVQAGVHYYVVTASNYWGESGRSNEVATPAIVTSPKNVIITITVTVTPENDR